MTSLSSTLPMPALHIQTVASPPAEALFAGQGRHKLWAAQGERQGQCIDSQDRLYEEEKDLSASIHITMY